MKSRYCHFNHFNQSLCVHVSMSVCVCVYQYLLRPLGGAGVWLREKGTGSEGLSLSLPVIPVFFCLFFLVEHLLQGSTQCCRMDFLLCSATVIYVNSTKVLCIREKTEISRVAWQLLHFWVYFSSLVTVIINQKLIKNLHKTSEKFSKIPIYFLLLKKQLKNL